jgi:gamma-glutamyltranspeptidase/glutathione hydrolase
MIAGPDPFAVEAGAQVLADGGNVVDAAVTCAFAQGVVNPTNSGLGGYSLFTIHQPGAGTGMTASLDAPATAGSRVREDMWVDRYLGVDASGWGYLLEGRANEFGYTSICTPGTVRGLSAALERWGSIDLARAVEPAARLAEEGFIVDERSAAQWFAPLQLSSAITVLDYVRASPEASRIYLPDGATPHGPGQIARNPDYGATLRTIGERGPGEFYVGELGDRIASDLATNDAYVTEADLERYGIREGTPLSGRYRGYEIATSGAPHGGPTLLGILRILEGWDLPSLGHNSAAYIVRFALAMKAAFADRSRLAGDPEFVDDRSAWLASADRGAHWRRRIDEGWEGGASGTPQDSGTAHVSVADATGTMVSLTHSLGGCSGVVTPGLGFMFNNSMANFDPTPGHPNSMAPGKGRTTGIAPTLLFRDGRPVVTLGASGATKIITALAQVIVNMVDFGMDPQEAILAPRFDCQGGPVRCHVRIPESVCEAVRRTLPIERTPLAYGGLGLVHAVRLGDDGRLAGGVDPGSAGMALAVDLPWPA